MQNLNWSHLGSQIEWKHPVDKWRLWWEGINRRTSAFSVCVLLFTHVFCTDTCNLSLWNPLCHGSCKVGKAEDGFGHCCRSGSDWPPRAGGHRAAAHQLGQVQSCLSEINLDMLPEEPKNASSLPFDRKSSPEPSGENFVRSNFYCLLR
jgi:hypothetical protein